MPSKKLPKVGDRIYIAKCFLTSEELSDGGNAAQPITERTVVRVNADLGYVYTEEESGCYGEWYTTVGKAKQAINKYIEAERRRLNAMEECIARIREEVMPEIIEQVRDLLTMDKFQEWLEKLSPDTKVGFSQSGKYNPISCYLRDSAIAASLPDIFVDKNWVWISKEDDEMVYISEEEYNESEQLPKVPEWISMAIQRFDRRPQHINAETACQVIKEVKELIKGNVKT